uniref:Uncharacterized protein n=1 Tax=Rhizophora mucronata TaxID=61149 RepID=A0A2P2NQ96_RHIMU
MEGYKLLVKYSCGVQSSMIYLKRKGFGQLFLLSQFSFMTFYFNFFLP